MMVDAQQNGGKKDKYISDVDDWIHSFQASMMQQMKDGKGDVVGQTMQQMVHMMMIMSMPKMMKQMMSDGDDNKYDAMLREIKEASKEREDRLMREIDALRQEKKEKELINEMERKLEPMKNALDEIREDKKKQPDDATISLMDKIDKLESQIQEMSVAQKAEATTPILKELSEMRRRIDDLNSARMRGDPLEDLLTQMEKIDKTKNRLASLMGISPKQAEDMSPTELIDTITKKGPEIVNSAKTMYDIIKGKELEDDNPYPDIPEVAAPIKGPSVPELKPELKQFIEEGHEEYLDPSDPSKGKMWVSKYGIPITSATNIPMNKDDVQKYALAYTDDFERLKSEIEDYVREQSKSLPDDGKVSKSDGEATAPPPPEQEESKPKQKKPEIKPAEPEKKEEEEISEEMLDAAEHPVK